MHLTMILGGEGLKTTSRGPGCDGVPRTQWSDIHHLVSGADPSSQSYLATNSVHIAPVTWDYLCSPHLFCCWHFCSSTSGFLYQEGQNPLGLSGQVLPLFKTQLKQPPAPIPETLSTLRVDGSLLPNSLTSSNWRAFACSHVHSFHSLSPLGTSQGRDCHANLPLDPSVRLMFRVSINICWIY